VKTTARPVVCARPPETLADHVTHAVVEGIKVATVVIREGEDSSDVLVQVLFGFPVRGVQAGDLVVTVGEPRGRLVQDLRAPEQGHRRVDQQAERTIGAKPHCRVEGCHAQPG